MMPPGLSERVDLTKASILKLQVYGLNIDVLRLDRIHPVISGNKWFKLKYYLQEAKRLGRPGLASFGGAYSNHLLATACACMQEGLKCVAIVRGEEPRSYSPTLRALQEYNIQLRFVSREAYRNKTELKETYSKEFGDYYWVNEGGQGEEGVNGAGEILRLLPSQAEYSYLICASGTGTMAAGIAKAMLPPQKLISVPVLKIMDRGQNELRDYIKRYAEEKSVEFWYDAHEGGYAKKTDRLVRFMAGFYDRYQIPTDFVYTGKLFMALMEKAEQGYFENDSKILAIHSGGLQGNDSLSIQEKSMLGWFR